MLTAHSPTFLSLPPGAEQASGVPFLNVIEEPCMLVVWQLGSPLALDCEHHDRLPPLGAIVDATIEYPRIFGPAELSVKCISPVGYQANPSAITHGISSASRCARA